jgi:hypothetical protein
MKLGNAAALGLLGWYLMVSPAGQPDAVKAMAHFPQLRQGTEERERATWRCNRGQLELAKPDFIQ